MTSTVTALVAKYSKGSPAETERTGAQSGHADPPEDSEYTIPGFAARHLRKVRTILGPGRSGYSDVNAPTAWLEVPYNVGFEELRKLARALGDKVAVSVGPGGRPKTMRIRVEIPPDMDEGMVPEEEDDADLDEPDNE